MYCVWVTVRFFKHLSEVPVLVLWDRGILLKITFVSNCSYYLVSLNPKNAQRCLDVVPLENVTHDQMFNILF